MNTSAEAADQVVRMSLNGVEAALKISGTGAKELSILLFKALKELSKQSKKTKGQIRLANLVKSGKKLEIYQVSDANLKRFCIQAKKYGMIYTVLKDRNKHDGLTEVMVKAEDKQKVDHIFEKLGLVPENVADVRPEKGKNKNTINRDSNEKSDADIFLEKVMEKPNPTKEEAHTTNPNKARTEKSSPFVPSSNISQKKEDLSDNPRYRPSVRKQLEEIKRDMEKQDKSNRNQTKTIKHKAPSKKKREKERF